MTCNYSLQLLSLRGLQSESGRAVLEVIVRTPRLLGTSKQKYASESFAVQAPRGVVLHWTQTRAAKAYVRLRLLPEEAQAAAAPAAAAAATVPTAATRPTPGSAAAVTTTTPGSAANVALLTSAPVDPVTAAVAAVAATTATTSEGVVSGCHGVRNTVEAPLQLQVGEQQQGAKAAVMAGSAAAAAAQVQQLTLALEPEAGSNGCSEQSCGGGGSSNATSSTGAVDLEFVVICTSVPQAWAWKEPASPPPLLADHPRQQPTAPRKRSWLLALGLGLGGHGARGDAATAITEAAGGSAGGDRVGTDGDAAASAGASGGGSGGTMAAQLGSHAANTWDLMATFSSATTTTNATVATVTTVAIMSSSLGGPGSSVPTAPYGFREVGGESGPWATPPPPPPPAGRRRMPRFGPDDAVPPHCGMTSAAGAPSPFAPVSLTAALSSPANALVSGTAAATACAPPPPAPQAAAPATAPSGCSEPQAPKRRRLGDFFARLFQTSPSNNQVRRITTVEHNSANGYSTAASAAAIADAVVPSAPPPSTGADGTPCPPLRWIGSPYGLTSLSVPSPRLGDVYRMQDNALASDAAVQIGFGGGDATAATAASASVSVSASTPESRPGNGLLPGLDSPGCGDGSPAGGPDRLAVEPPVEGMAAASLASPMTTSPVAPMGGCFFWRYGAAARARAAAAAALDLRRAGSAPVAGAASAATAVTSTAAAGIQLNTLSAADALPALSSSISDTTGGSSGDQPAGYGQGSKHRLQHQHQTHQLNCIQKQNQGYGADGEEAAAPPAGPSWSHPLEGEISRVMEFVSREKEMDEETRALALSQCQFLLDCLRNPEMCWLVGDSLLQLKREVGFPFDTGVPIPGAPGWFRLVLQTLQHVPTAATAEVLKVRWACIDQRQVGGTNACAAIGLEVAAWCLGAVQRWRHALSAAAAAAAAGASVSGARRDSTVWPQPLLHPDASAIAGSGGNGGGNGGACRRELAPVLSRSQRDRERERLASSIAMEDMSGIILEHCIRVGTDVWQAVLVQSPAARVASSTGDFDLEHMLQLGGYSQRLQLADYSAASLLLMEDASGRGGSGGGSAAAAAASSSSSSLPRPAAAATSLMFPTAPGQPSTAASEGRLVRPPSLQLPPATDPPPPPPCGSGTPPPPPSTRGTRQGSQGGLPTFAALVRSLTQGVYVLGWRGHFATLWMRPGRVVHLIDSLGARLAADCPLAFVLEFDTPSDFLAFFLGRHTTPHDAAATDDIEGANLAGLIEVHRLELL